MYDYNTPQITKGSWAHYHGSRTYLLGEIYEVIAVHGDRVRLRGIQLEFVCSAEKITVLPDTIR